MRYLLLLLTLLLTAGCEPPQSFEDEPDMIRQTRNPPVLPHSPRGIPQVVPTIPREGLWSGYNQLGYIAKYGPDRRNTQTILKLDEWGAPEVWTVSLYVKEDFDPADFDGLNIKARINFGAGGSTQQYECDWLNGSQISLPMNAINVEAIFSEVDAVEGAGLTVGVQLARGSRGGTEPPRLTLKQEGLLGAGESETFAVPLFAKRIVMVTSSLSVAEIAAFFSSVARLRLTSGTGASNYVTAVTNGLHAEGSEISLPVAGSSRVAIVSNTSAGADILRYSLFAELDG